VFIAVMEAKNVRQFKKTKNVVERKKKARTANNVYKK
jgi:hypothetical protein